MRVAQIVGKMENGGVEAVVMNYYRHIDRSKVQFDFYADEDSTWIPKDEIESLGGHVYIVPPYQRLHKYIPALIKLFKDNGYKIVHAHLNTLNIFPLFAAKRAGVPVRICHNHSTAARGEIKKNILKYSFRPFAKVYATHYAACSKHAGEWLFGKKSVERGEVTIFNNAIDLEKFKFDPTVRDEVRKELGIEGKFVIGHVGRFCYQKNQDFLIDVFAKVHEQSKNAVLLLVGDGPDRARIEERVKSNPWRDDVIILGNRGDVERIYPAMDVFVFPSRYEGLGMAAVEAQAAGLPCLLSDKMTEEAKITDNAFFLSLESGIEAWSATVCSADSGDKERDYSNLTGNGFDIKIQGDTLLQFYNNLIKQHLTQTGSDLE